jgi:DNA-binding transcriptional MerR regulator
MNDQKIFIGDLSKKTSIPVKTIWYYEDFGILAKPKRAASEYRVYIQKDIDKLLFIKKAKELGQKLSEIKSIMENSKKGLAPCCCLVRRIFTDKIKEYETKIEELTEIKRILEKKLKTWVQPKRAKELKYAVCPQIEKTEIKKGGKENDKKKR